MYKANQLSSIAVGDQRILRHCLLSLEAIVDHKDLRRHERLEGMLNPVDESAPFHPLAIHASLVSGVAVQIAMY